MSEASPRSVEKLDRPTLDVRRLDTGSTFRREAYAALKQAITAMDIYDHPEEILKRFPPIEVVERPKRAYSNLIHGITEMKVRIPS